jgi:hypothetical protein
MWATTSSTLQRLEAPTGAAAKTADGMSFSSPFGEGAVEYDKKLRYYVGPRSIPPPLNEKTGHLLRGMEQTTGS